MSELDLGIIERSSQSIPLTEAAKNLPVTDTPLHELYDDSPDISSYDRYRNLPVFPFANDELATPYQQILPRTATSEYQEAKHRVAVIVGEGALLAALPLIPEETIILLDVNPDMTSFMRNYVRAIINSGNMNDWFSDLAASLDDDVSDVTTVYSRIKGDITLSDQAMQWRDIGLKHPLVNDEAYQLSKSLAQKKAIIPWRADLASVDDMTYLGECLRFYGATVTMLNLTNAVLHLRGRNEYHLPQIQKLPITDHAPILTTSPYGVPDDIDFRGIAAARAIIERTDAICFATGPFFGVKNLLDNIEPGHDDTASPRGALFTRKYAPWSDAVAIS